MRWDKCKTDDWQQCHMDILRQEACGMFSFIRSIDKVNSQDGYLYMDQWETKTTLVAADNPVGVIDRLTCDDRWRLNSLSNHYIPECWNIANNIFHKFFY